MKLFEILLITILIIMGQVHSSKAEPDEGKDECKKIDDWKYKPEAPHIPRSLRRGGPMMMPQAMPLLQAAAFSSPGPGSIGLAVGGAKDVGNFRENIEKNFLPLPTDVTYEGLFYDYFFDFSRSQSHTKPVEAQQSHTAATRVGDTPCSHLFCPKYSVAISSDPMAKLNRDNSIRAQRKAKEYYVAVGLGSGLGADAAEVKRKRLAVVVVLDISGSMSAGMDTYYYDVVANLTRRAQDMGKPLKSKLDAATESLADMFKHLKPEDHYGVVLFDHEAYLGKPISEVKCTDMEAIARHLKELRPNGGTNMDAGWQKGTEMLLQFKNETMAKSNKSKAEFESDWETRIIFMTDAQPNFGDLNENALLQVAKKNSDDHKIFMTFIGMGVDFNSELVEAITHVRGANYYTIQDTEEMKRRLVTEFDSMVTPVVFDLNLSVKVSGPGESKAGFTISDVFGSPGFNLTTGNVLSVTTLFPSAKQEQAVKGGVILVKLKPNEFLLELPTAQSFGIVVVASYVGRDGKPGRNANTVPLIIPGTQEAFPDSFDSSGVRKSVLLTRYANLLRSWLVDQRKIAEAKPVSSSRSGDEQKPGQQQQQQPSGLSGVWPFNVVRQLLSTSEDTSGDGAAQTTSSTTQEETQQVGGETKAEETDGTSALIPPLVIIGRHIPVLPIRQLSKWERKSLPLAVMSHYGMIFRLFKQHFEAEMSSIQDDTLKKEVDILTKLIDKAPKSDKE
jgi:Ca-activated chloride channel family protein